MERTLLRKHCDEASMKLAAANWAQREGNYKWLQKKEKEEVMVVQMQKNKKQLILLLSL